MRFSDSIQYGIPKPIKYANYDSSPFNSDDTLSDDTSSQEDISLSTSGPPSNPFFQDNSSSKDSGFQSIQKLINLIPPIEHAIILQMTYQSIIINLTDKPKPIILYDTNHEKIITSSYHNRNFSTPDQSLKIS